MPTKIDVIGQRFGRLVVLHDAPRAENGRRRVSCVCDCGTPRIVDPRSLLKGHTQSCGCYHKDRVGDLQSKRLKHGGSRARSNVYNIWVKMKGRCDNPNDKKYPDYGGRGISVCSQWLSDFAQFRDDMGPRPSAQHSIERVDVNGNYEPNNCRWATPAEQSLNKRKHRMVEHMGLQMPLSEACRQAGVNYRSALYRLNQGLHWLPAPPALGGSHE